MRDDEHPHRQVLPRMRHAADRGSGRFREWRRRHRDSFATCRAGGRACSEPVLPHQAPGVSLGSGIIALTRTRARTGTFAATSGAVKPPIDPATSTTSSRPSMADTTRSVYSGRPARESGPASRRRWRRAPRPAAAGRHGASTRRNRPHRESGRRCSWHQHGFLEAGHANDLTGGSRVRRVQIRPSRPSSARSRRSFGVFTPDPFPIFGSQTGSHPVGGCCCAWRANRTWPAS